MTRKQRAFLVVGCGIVTWTLGCSRACAQSTTTYRPPRQDASEALIATLEVPPGFEVTVFARNVRDARMMALGPDGSVLVTQPGDDQVLLLRDRDGDGSADERWPIVDDLHQVHGIAVRGNDIYLAQPTRVVVGKLSGNRLSKLRTVLDDLPEGGRHPNRTMAFGPDGRLYVSVGSTCDACVESNLESATLLVAQPGTWARRIFAHGLRNTIGFAWHPRTGQLWGMDNGTDDRGDEQPPEELNRLVGGAFYGWPWSYGARIPDARMEEPEELSIERLIDRSTAPVLDYTAHAAPIGMAFYDGTEFPPDYRGDAFVALHGSWNRSKASGYEVVRVRFRDGRPIGFQPFLRGFLVAGGLAQFGRPTGLLVLPDGTLLVSEDENGVIYRVRYRR